MKVFLFHSFFTLVRFENKVLMWKMRGEKNCFENSKLQTSQFQFGVNLIVMMQASNGHLEMAKR